MRILLAGGGTGGHVFPLISVARKLKEVLGKHGEESPEFMFLGPAGEFISVFKNEGITVKSIFAGKLRRYFSFLNIIDIFLIPLGFFQAYFHIFLFMPDVVFSKGGYGSVPVIIISWIFRIPIIIHESDIVPGIANKFTSRLAKKIIVAFDETVNFFPKEKTIVLGNPARSKFFSISSDEARRKFSIIQDKPILFVMGGSQGARQINDLLFLALPDAIKKYEIIHQCGEANYKRMRKEADFQLKSKEERGLYHLYGMMNEEELASAYKLARVIVSRAGSGAIFEIALSGKPSILMPYRPSAGGHQEKNAHTYAKIGAARILEGKNISPHMFIGAIDSITNNPEKEKEMSEAARQFSKPDSAEKIAAEILNII